MLISVRRRFVTVMSLRLDDIVEVGVTCAVHRFTYLRSALCADHNKGGQAKGAATIGQKFDTNVHVLF